MEKQYKKYSKKKKIIEEYNLSSEVYDKRYKLLQEEKYKIALDRYNTRGKIILDLGCGTGLLLEFILKSEYDQFNRDSNYIGVDISWNMLIKLKSKIIQRKTISKIMFMLADIENLPFRDNSFNLILSFTSFQNLPNIEKGIFDSLRVSVHNSDLIFTILRKKLELNSFISLLNPIVSDLVIINQENLEDVVIQAKFLKE
ncbi:MAG: class I SAM-dependent methyltransferase [Promethearchaeota archaeon]